MKTGIVCAHVLIEHCCGQIAPYYATGAPRDLQEKAGGMSTLVKR